MSAGAVIGLLACVAAAVSFWRWLGVERNQYDHASFQISSDGSTFHTLWENGPTTLEGGSWEFRSLAAEA